jgi:hypothetical protein
MLKIRNRMGIPESKNSGMDTLELCLDKDHYQSYPKDISYRYNSRGFRDHEWPEDLSDVIWCVGDSFTVGIGQPFEETWPYLLGERLGKTCLNIGEDRCANDTMALRIQEICKLHSPKLVVVMWSYLSRRRVNNKNVHHDKKHFGNKADIENFTKNYTYVNNLPTTIIHSTIPGAFMGDQGTEYIMEKIMGINQSKQVEQLDWARDHHHFDSQSSAKIVDWIIGEIK